MKINCYDTFSPLKEVILGSVSMNVIDSIQDENKKEIMRDTLAYVNEDLLEIEKTFQEFGVHVHRPDTDFDFSANLITPFFSIKGSRIPLAPSDIILAHADKIIITSGGDRLRFFEQICYSKIFDHYSDSAIINMPMPRLDDRLYLDAPEKYYFNNNEALIEAANVQLFGKDIFLTKALTANQKGIHWLKTIIGSEYRFHILPDRLSGHIDNVFNILRPGLLVSNHPKSELPDFFESWEVIHVTPLQRTVPDLISTSVQDDDFCNTLLDINLVCLDADHVMVMSHLKDSDLIKEIEKHKIQPIFVPMRYCHFINQGLKCMIQDTIRLGSLEDYTR